MTRINLVEPSQLTNKHLLAEYRELPRVFTAVEKLVYSVDENAPSKWRDFINKGGSPDQYTLGTGHVKFFYQRLPWLLNRFISICRALSNRNVNINMMLRKRIISDASDLINILESHMIHNWQPSPAEIYLNMARLCKRSKIENVLNELAS